MPLVFVHGVNTRMDPESEASVRVRDSLFRRFALGHLVTDPSVVVIKNPYWGDLAAQFKWNHASLPGRDAEGFGTVDELLENLLSESSIPLPEEPNRILCTVADESLADAIDLLGAAALKKADEESRAPLTAFLAKALAYAEIDSHPAWLSEATDDIAFLTALGDAVDAWESPDSASAAEASGPALESFGMQEVGDRLREGVSRLRSVGADIGSGLLLAGVRKPLHENLSRFIGDILVYLNRRGDRDQPGPIVTRILEAIDLAGTAATEDDRRLVIVAHSMGGIIVYDILSHFRPALEVDAFVTVGSQVGMFEELKLFRASDPGVPADPGTDRVPKPAGVSAWLNVFDRNDVLSFAGAGVFSGVEDYEYSTGKGLLSAHTTYFQRPSFHDRLGRRLRTLLS